RLDENEKPEKIVFTIITDGMENSSREFTKEKIKQMIEEKEKLNWNFVYLSADMNAIDEAEHLGFYKDRVMGYDKDSTGVYNMVSSFSEKIFRLRSMNKIYDKIVFEDSDREKQDIEKDRK
ncbi:MAG: hypothetical protein JW866_08215, partial [Ignavibacteriales bacterium]|nr:hypothetical protein [Ignavibacteriales bacterium]